ncbi:putative membrane protein YdbT with pleckstrin-like domain [Sphingopyxis sp. OAS728]|uniref:PH domain-containing protein n=1 Tax=Sphingopyxis sp. OAS728 TaxID=2663823 RepID=UPI00178B7D6C|nr:PH domain-containing protein [Sphingopyxis sp. OAS728]MBE1527789.1 putative membrane protein YdbT with pleckstrin-like domain [Sphingopyxis sp. OAS728]
MPEVLDRFRSSTWGWLRGTLAGWLTLLLCLVGVGLVIALIQWIRFLDVTYELTEDRLILRKGIFVKSIDEIELYRVKDVRMDFTLINQWAGIGTIAIDSSDETTRDGALVIPHIERAAERREELRRLVDAARQKRRVRELDVSSELL